jgi:hypothetical protein
MGLSARMASTLKPQWYALLLLGLALLLPSIISVIWAVLLPVRSLARAVAFAWSPAAGSVMVFLGLEMLTKKDGILPKFTGVCLTLLGALLFYPLFLELLTELDWLSMTGEPLLGYFTFALLAEVLGATCIMVSIRKLFPNRRVERAAN